MIPCHKLHERNVLMIHSPYLLMLHERNVLWIHSPNLFKPHVLIIYAPSSILQSCTGMYWILLHSYTTSAIRTVNKLIRIEIKKVREIKMK